MAFYRLMGQRSHVVTFKRTEQYPLDERFDRRIVFYDHFAAVCICSILLYCTVVYSIKNPQVMIFFTVNLINGGVVFEEGREGGYNTKYFSHERQAP